MDLLTKQPCFKMFKMKWFMMDQELVLKSDFFKERGDECLFRDGPCEQEQEQENSGFGVFWMPINTALRVVRGICAGGSPVSCTENRRSRGKRL